MTAGAALWSGAFGDAWIARNRGTAFPGRARFWQALLEAWHPRTVLEVGAGAGHNLRELDTPTRPRLLVGLDVNPSALGASCQWADYVLQADAEDLPVGSSTFDLVILTGVLMHQPEALLARCMLEAQRVTRRLIVAAEPETAGPDEDLDWRGLRGVLFRRAYGHRWRQACPELTVQASGAMAREAWGDDVAWWVFAKRAGAA